MRTLKILRLIFLSFIFVGVMFPIHVIKFESPVTIFADLPNGRPRASGTESEYIGTLGKNFVESPQGIAVNSTGYVYVADNEKNQINVFSPQGHLVRAWGSTGSGEGQFSGPRSIAINGSGNVFVAEYNNHRIQCFDQMGVFLWQGTFPEDYHNTQAVAFNGSGCVYATTDDAACMRVFSPTGEYLFNWSTTFAISGIAINASGDVYVARLGAAVVYTQTGAFVRQWACNPSGIALNATGDVFVTEGARVRVFDQLGNYLSEWITSTTYPPRFLAFDLDGFLYVTSSSQVAKYTQAGTLVAEIAHNWANGTFKTPSGIATNATGAIYVADQNIHRVSAFAPTGEFLYMWGRNGGIFPNTGTGNGEFNQPRGIAVGGSGYVYVADTGNHRIQVFTQTGQYYTKWGSFGAADSLFNQPSGVATNSSGHVFVADTGNNRVAVFTQAGAFVTNLTSGFSSPAGVAVNTSNYVYVTDTGNHRMVVFSPDGAYVTEWGSQGTNPGEFNSPRGVSINGSGTVFVADTLNHRVQVFDATGKFLSEWGGFGNETSLFNQPAGIAASPFHHVFVADSLNSRVQVYGNTLPDASGAHVDPDPAFTADDLQVDEYFNDPDGDPDAQSQIRWYRNGTLQPYLNNSRIVPACWTNKTDQWHATVLPCDAWGNGSLQTTLNVTIENTPPEASNLLINSGSSAFTGDDLVLTFTEFDADGDPTQARIRWYKDDVAQPDFNDQKTVPGCWTNRSQEWNASVELFDGEVYNTEVWAIAVTIDNSLPTYASAALSPNDPVTTEDLTVAPAGYSDADGEGPFAPRVRWYRNNTLQSYLNDLLAVPACWTNRTDLWNASVQAYDGVDYGPAIWSQVITVNNTPPTATGFAFSNTAPTTIDDVALIIQGFSDVDGDDPHPPRIRWYRNLSYYSALDDLSTLPAGYTNKFDEWNATVEIFDGVDYGLLQWTPILTIRNFAPVVTKVWTGYFEYKPGDPISINIQFVDYDFDTIVRSEIRWYLDGVHQPTYDNLFDLSEGITLAGEKWYCEVRLADDTEFGLWVTLAEITIQTPFPTEVVVLSIVIPAAGVVAVMFVLRLRKRKKRDLVPSIS